MDAIRDRTGLEACIVDVNNLSRARGDFSVLAASSGVPIRAVKAAMLDNPGGNADEQTPIVVIRPQGAPR